MDNNSKEKVLISVIREVLHPSSEGHPDFSGVNWQETFAFASKHNLAHLLFLYFREHEVNIGQELYKECELLYCQAAAVNFTQEYELHWLLETCKGKNIRVMPLKGCVLKNLYPSPEMRTMGDLDILIDPEDAQKLRQILCERGYQCVMYGVHHHDKYVLPPMLTIEVHTSLVSPENRELYRYFQQGFALGRPCSDNPWHYEMRKKEYFLFYLAHFYKHFDEEGGAGIRFVLDFYIQKQAWPKLFCEKVLKKDLIRLGLWEFFCTMDYLAEAWFGADGSMDDVPWGVQKYIFNCGVFGTDAQRFQNHVEKYGRMGYFMERLFPGYYYMCRFYPVLRKVPVLLPVCWILRIMVFPFQKKALFRRRMGQFFGKHIVD